MRPPTRLFFWTLKGRTAAAIVTILLTLSVSNAGIASAARLLLVDADQELEAALRATLAPWGTEIVVEKITGPGNTMPGSAERARGMARRRQARAVVWISRSKEGFALWMYDSIKDRVLSRRLPTPPPFSEATAASVALIVKTLLLSSELSPPSERVPAPHDEPSLEIGLLGGVRLAAISRGGIEPRLGLRLVSWPRTFAGLSGGAVKSAVGVGFEVIGGPGRRVEDPRFSGRWTDTTLLAGVYGRLRPVSALELGLAPGAGVDVTTMSGVVLDSAENTREIRLNPFGSAQAEVGWRLARELRIGLRLGLIYAFHRQTFLVHGEPVLEVHSPIFDPMLTADLGLP